VNDGRLMEYVEKEKECPIAKVSRVKMKDDAPLMRVVPTAYSDIDMNGHVNSVKYIEHALDLWDTEFYKHHWLHRFEIAYVAEAHLGDDLLLFMDEAEKQAGEEEQDEFFVRIAKRAAGDDAEPVEVCRCRMVFRGVRQ
jgi:acyl-ACP thioesterase